MYTKHAYINSVWCVLCICINDCESIWYNIQIVQSSTLQCVEYLIWLLIFFHRETRARSVYQCYYRYCIRFSSSSILWIEANNTIRIAAYSCINVQDFKSRAQCVLGIYVTRHVRVRKYKRNPHVTHTHTHTYTHTHSHTYYTVVHTSHIILYIYTSCLYFVRQYVVPIYAYTKN